MKLKLLMIPFILILLLPLVSPSVDAWCWWGWFGTTCGVDEPTAPDSPIGYRFLDDNEVLYIWNTQDNYFFDVDSGIQLTNHYEDYWTRNIFCLGYYNNGVWNKIKCADELTGFEKSIESDDETYVTATLWKNIEYNGYDLRFGVQYHLELDDKNLSITVSIKNIGIDIPFDLGFAWKVTDWNIPSNKTDDRIIINNMDYLLNGTYDLTFKNMDETYFKGYDDDFWGEEFLRVDWNEDLNYAVKMFGNGNQEDFYVALLINAGHFNSQQEKSTTFQWIDALVVGTNVGFVTARPSGDPGGSSSLTLHDKSIAFKVTAPSSAIKVTEIGYWQGTLGASTTVSVGMYDHNIGDNNPETNLVRTYNSLTDPDDQNTWVYITTDISISGDTIYWIAVQMDDILPSYTDYTASAGQKVDTTDGDGILMAPWGTTDNTYEYIASIYAIYSTLPPAYSDFKKNISDANIYSNSAIQFNITIADVDSNVLYWNFSWNCTGDDEWLNVTNSTDLTDPSQSNNSIISIGIGEVCGYMFCSSDDTAAISCDDVRTFEIIASPLPIINGTLNNTAPERYDIINISFNATDTVGLTNMNITINFSTGTVKMNYTVSGISASIWNDTIITDGVGTVLNITGYATNWEGSTTQNSTIIIIIDTTSPNTTIHSNNFFSDDNTTYINLDESNAAILNLTFSDSNNVSGFNLTILTPNGSVSYNLTNTSLVGTIANFSSTVDVSSFFEMDGIYTINITVYDGDGNTETLLYEYYLINPTLTWLLPPTTLAYFTNYTIKVSLNVSSAYRNLTQFRLYDIDKNLINTSNVSQMNGDEYFYNATFSGLKGDVYYINATHVDNATGGTTNTTTLTFTGATFNITFRDEYDELLILGDRIYLDAINPTFAKNYSTVTSKLGIVGWTIGDYRLTYDSNDYGKRSYYYTVANETNVSLTFYSLTNSNGTDVKFSVQDNSGNPLVDATVYLKKYYVSTNSYKTVAMVRTNEEGDCVIDVDFNDAYYQILVVYGEYSLETIGTRIISLTRILTLNLQADPFAIEDAIDDVTTSLTFNNDTQTFSYSYTDTTGTPRTATLEVIKTTPASSTTVCTATDTSVSGTLLCEVNTTAVKGTYIAKGYISINPRLLTDTYTKITGLVRDFQINLGKQGIFFTILLAGCMAGLGALVSPAVALVMFMVGIAVASFMGLSIISMSFLAFLILAVAVIIFKMKN